MSDLPPKIRADIEIIPTQYQGENVFLVRDALGLIPDPIVLKAQGLAFLQLIDGKREPQDIQLELIRASQNSFVSLEAVHKTLNDLDRAGILDSENYKRNKAELIADYQQKKIRSAFLAGKAYPESAAELQEAFDALFKPSQPLKNIPENESIRALAAPHIDLSVGKEIYARAYRSILTQPPKRVLLLGTGHNLSEHFFAVTNKDFQTPFGLVTTDKKWTHRLAVVPDIASPYDISHKNEHSLEFQLLFLQYLFGSEFSMVPVLCGSFLPLLNSYTRLSDVPGGIKIFLDILKQYLDEDPASLVVAGVDFSHIGPKFGHPQSARSLLPEAKEHDSRLIAALCEGNGADFWQEISKTKDEYNVCGFTPLACLLELLPEAKGHLLGYDFWEEEATQSAVSFAALAFT